MLICEGTWRTLGFSEGSLARVGDGADSCTGVTMMNGDSPSDEGDGPASREESRRDDATVTLLFPPVNLEAKERGLGIRLVGLRPNNELGVAREGDGDGDGDAGDGMGEGEDDGTGGGTGDVERVRGYEIVGFATAVGEVGLLNIDLDLDGDSDGDNGLV